MADKEIKKEIYTTCPFTGQEDAWTEEAFGVGKWKGRSSVDGSTISADSYEGLRHRYAKLTLARLELEDSE
jgi:hypothetical protein